MVYRSGHPDYVPPPPPTFQQQWRIDHGRNPYTMDFIRGVDDLDENGNPLVNGGIQNMNDTTPRSFNPQNQSVLDGAAAALDATKRDRLNPMYGSQQGYAAPGANGAGIGGTSPVPGIIGRGMEALSQGLNYAQDGMEGYARGRNTLPQAPPGQQFGYAAPGLNTQIQGSPGLRGFVDSVGSGLEAYGKWFGGVSGNVSKLLSNLSPIQGEPRFGQATLAYDGPGTPPISNPINSQLAPAYDPRTASINSARSRVDAGVQQSQQDTPMRPIPGGDPQIAAMQAEIERGTRQQNIMFEPGATSSGGATSNFRKIQPEDLNGTTAGTVNGYSGQTGYAQNPMRLDPEEKLNLAEGNAQRIAGGGAAADPTNAGGRFGGAYGAGLDADATALAEGRAVRTADGKVVYFTGTQESAQKAYMSARANGYGRTPEQEAARHAKAVEQANARAEKHQAFKDANGGMSYKQYDRMTGGSNGNNALTMKAVREGRLSPQEANYRMQIRAEKALRRSGNPISGGTSQAGRLYPDMMPKQGGTTQPAVQANPIFGPGASNTVENVNARSKARKDNVTSSPTLSAWGVSPDLDPAGFAEAVGQNLFVQQPDGKFGFAEVSDDGITSIFNQIKLFDPTKDGKPPFPEGSIYNQVWGMAENTPAAELRKIFGTILNNMNAVPPAPAGQAGQGSWTSQGKM